MFLLGAFVGGCFAIYLVSLLVGRLLFRNAAPDTKAMASVGVAWVLVGILGGLGMADGGPFHWQAWFYYVPSAVVMWLYRRRELRNAWNASSDVFE